MAKQIENPEKVKGNKMTESSSAPDDTPGSRSIGKDGKPLQGWELREKMKHQDRIPIPGARRPLRRESSIDPLLPPAFREFQVAKQPKKEVDDYYSLDSVHTARTQLSTLSSRSLSDSDTDDSDASFDSFAALEGDEEDDEAYREGRNQIATQTVGRSWSSPRSILRKNDSRFKKGVHGTTLGLIAE